jgi:hypothetical protein
MTRTVDSTTSGAQATSSSSAPPPPPRAPGEPDPSLDSFEKVMAAMDAELARARGAVESSQSLNSTPSTTTSALNIKGQNSGEGQRTGKGNGKGKNTDPAPSSSSKNSALPPLPPLPTEADLDAMSADDLLAMDRELRAALKGAGIEDDDGDDDLDLDADDDGLGLGPGSGPRPSAADLDDDDKREYRMMKDFLESYRSQGGQSGVVGNLFGRLAE